MVFVGKDIGINLIMKGMPTLRETQFHRHEMTGFRVIYIEGLPFDEADISTRPMRLCLYLAVPVAIDKEGYPACVVQDRDSESLLAVLGHRFFGKRFLRHKQRRPCGSGGM